jgi:hypothetical protein
MTFDAIEAELENDGTLLISHQKMGLTAQMHLLAGIPIISEPSQHGILDALLKLNDALLDNNALQGKAE